VLKGKKPNRESVLEPTTPRTSAVPPGRHGPRRVPIRIPGGRQPQAEAPAGHSAGYSGNDTAKARHQAGLCMLSMASCRLWRIVGTLPAGVKMAARRNALDLCMCRDASWGARVNCAASRAVHRADMDDLVSGRRSTLAS